MNLKFLSTVTTIIILLIAELLSYINLSIWDITASSPDYSEKEYYKDHLTTLYNFIEKTRIAFYFLFLVSVIATSIIYICF